MSGLPRILLVDDDESQVMLARRAIERSGLAAELVAVGSGREALYALGLEPGGAAAEVGAAVVLLDVGLPDMSGWDVLARIRREARLRGLPVVMVSNSDRPEDVYRGYATGANSYLLKRHEPGPAGDYLARAADYWVRLNVAPRPGSATRPGPR